MTALDDAAETLAKALRPKHGGHGWAALAAPCREALRDLVQGGWTPPAPGDDDGLRAELEAAYRRLDDLNRHVDRLVTEETAFREFRGLLVQIAHPAGRNPLRLDPHHPYTAAEVQAWVLRLLDAADRRGDAARRQAAANGQARETARERTQLALFETPAVVRGIEPVAADAAEAAGL